jgi:hypothetical protein
MQNMTVELHDSSSGGGRSKASDSHEYMGQESRGHIQTLPMLIEVDGFATLPE